MQRLLFPFWLIVTFLVCFTPSKAQFNKAYFFYKGEELISRGNYADAIPVLNTLLNVDSTIHEAWFLRGVARYYQNDLVGAGNDFSKCLNINPLFSQAYQYNAMVLQQLGKSVESIECIQKAIELRPASAQYLFTYGVILFQQEQYHDALYAFNQVLKIDDRIPDAWVNRGTTRLMLSDSSGALTDYSAAINLNPFNANPYLRRGALYAQQSNYPLALQDLNQAIGIDSTLAQAYFTRALVFYYQKHYSQALSDLNKVLQLEHRNTLALFNRAIISYEVGNPESAIDDLTRLSSIIPTNVLVHYYLASIRYELGYLPMALENINKAIAIFPEFANAYRLRAEIKTKKGDLKGAEADIAQGNRLAQAYSNRAINDIASVIDSTGKLKRLLSLDEELDITSSISMEQLRTRILTIVYPIITLKVDKIENVKPRNWQSSNLRQILATQSCRGYSLFFEYDTINQHSQLETIATDSLSEICKAIAHLQGNYYTAAMKEFSETLKADSSNTLYRLAEVLAKIKMTQFVENVKNKSLQSGKSNISQKTIDNKPYITAGNDLKTIALDNDFEGIVPYNIGVMFMHTENNDLAIEWFSKAISINPLIHGAWYNRGLLYLINNETVKGCADLRKAVNIGNNQASEVVARFCKK
ncbi:MAG: tetratricopeptide repeat protein [Tenuifilum sp.]|uniref:tetratricopeptide repeat protein n=1 Tax=Tenuifilum sp. TaxID=2760880 RepID=UPI001B4B2EB4|nr:tetratricopeptide repeat protein [Bacteroidales bacterium]HOK60094.1 tetratricopeptide repeat protein [Tenuifilum sp.]MBP9029490.1 tetratricopeptide repeat protein [Bacteroidales bacterium]HOK84986.1 tetratricopeptide repeat protein [Tenuifilum sp.]HON69543.1 tetratricopeptide repeat protein [Tenuifilum sp.]